MEGESPNGPLTGFRVLDLADEKGSFCSKLLADLGARVIKIEKPGGDDSRSIGPFAGESSHPEKSLFFLYHNANKFGITLNLEHTAGREIFFRLAEKADIVVETFPPGYLQAAGLGFEFLSGKNPRLILVSITGFGQEGPSAQQKSCDLVAAASGGQMHVSGSPSSSPLKLFGEQSFYAASLYGAIAALLAFRKRALSGKGDHIDISLQESVVSTSEDVMVRYFSEKSIPGRQGSLYGNDSFCILPCKDGHVLINPFQQWETLTEWMEREGMAEDLTRQEWKEEGYRRAHSAHVRDVLTRWTETHFTDELIELGQLMHFPWAALLTPTQVSKNLQLRTRAFFHAIEPPQPDSAVTCPGTPYAFASSFPAKRKRAPFIGEDNTTIYINELGFSERELNELTSTGVI